MLSPDSQAALLLALHNNAPDFAELFLQRGATPWHVSPACQLDAHMQLRPRHSDPGRAPSWEMFLEAVSELYAVSVVAWTDCQTRAVPNVTSSHSEPFVPA